MRVHQFANWGFLSLDEDFGIESVHYRPIKTQFDITIIITKTFMTSMINMKIINIIINKKIMIWIFVDTQYGSLVGMSAMNSLISKT